MRVSSSGTSRSHEPGETALAGALGYRFLSAGFRYPDSGTRKAIGELGLGVGKALRILEDGKAEPMEEGFRESWKLFTSLAPEGLEEHYVSIFGHSVHGTCPPYEAEYGSRGERLQQPHEISDLSGFYRSFSLDLKKDAHERPDFISMECEFAAFLCLKSAYAEEANDSELARICVEGRARFLKEHLGRWTPSFVGRLLRQAEKGFYPALARLTVSFLGNDCRRLGVDIGRETLELRLPVQEPEGCQGCPQAGEAGFGGPTAGQEV